MMASSSRRRSRQQVEEDDDEDMEFAHSPSTQRASLSPEPAQRAGKRQRRTRTSSNNETGDIEEELEEVDVDEGIVVGEDVDEDDGDDSDVEATQHETAELLKRIEKSKTGAHEPNEAEVIKSIDLINFMCHRRLHVPLGDKINFIIGHNGSGKSAILTALTICLGGKATATNRGTSLKNLIKEGENSASIIIKLLNAGDHAYKPDLYGDVIEIERRFSKDGSSGYRIKSANGHTVSTKREELQEIMDHINLQVDNPMTVLTQDTARQFLGNSSAGDKYKLFMKGVQLAQLDTDYNMVEEQISALQTTLDTKKEALEDLHEKEKTWRMKVKIFEQSAEIEARVRTLQNHFAWSQVKAQEKIVEENEKKMEGFRARIEAAKAHVTEQEAKRLDQDLVVQHTTDAAEQLKAQTDAVKQRSEEAKEELNQLTARMKEYANEQGTLEAGVKACEDTIKQNNNLIQEERRREDNDGERLRDQECLTDLETNITNLTDRILELEDDYKKKHQEIQETESRESNLKDRKQSALKALSNAKDQLNQLQQSKHSDLVKYHKELPRVLAAIEKNKNRFRIMPIGPLGMHVKIRQEKWAGICEVIFGRILNGFLCADHSDTKQLRDILMQCKCDVPVVTSERDLFDYRSGEPDSQYDTVLRILDISDEFVKRQLITQNHIEATILIENRAQADDVMYSRPARVGACFAINPERRGCGYRVGGVAGGSGTAPVGPWRGPARLTNRSVDEQIAEKREEVERLDQEAKTLDSEFVSQQRRLRQLRTDWRVIQASKSEVETAKDRALQEADDLRDKLQAQQPNSGNIVVYEEAIADAQEEKKVLLGQIAAIIEEQKTLLEERKPLSQKAREMSNAIKRLNDDIANAEKECTRVTAERMQITTNIRHYQNQVNETERAYEAAQGELETQKLTLEDITEGARRYCPERVPNHEIKLSVDKIKEKMKVFQKQLAQLASEAGISEEEAHRKFTEIHEQYKNANQEMKSLRDLKETLWQSYRERKSRYYKFRKIIAVKAKTTFLHLLKQRAFQGKLSFDHKKQEIRIQVNPAGESQHGSRKDPKSLSGGEKSFAQICMLLSVWEAMGSPIRALDEFDVFMDAVNRKTSMALMIEAAKFSVGKQFILITPQDMGNVAMGPDIRVHRMKDPERGQRTLDDA